RSQKPEKTLIQSRKSLFEKKQCPSTQEKSNISDRNSNISEMDNSAETSEIIGTHTPEKTNIQSKKSLFEKKQCPRSQTPEKTNIQSKKSLFEKKQCPSTQEISNISDKNSNISEMDNSAETSEIR
ncbi:unnamed protein product, partial [Meganyctiphanes norvegica]